MLAFLQENLATILIGIVLIAIIVFIVIKLVRDKAAGRSSCGCGCEHCAMHEHCGKH